ncbi:MAG: YIP1 family protein [bacterium]|nr:YIP1 family protein [bacterium]
MTSIEAMNQRDIQKPGETRLARSAPNRPQRGLLGSMSTVLLQPALFFRTLPPMSATRQWLWVALLVLALVGFNAVRRESLSASPAGEAPIIAPDVGGGILDPRQGGAPIDPGMSLEVPPAGNPQEAGTGDEMDTATRWTTALIAASGVVLIWFGQTVLLSEVSLLNGTAPRLAHNFQIAIWASLPLGLLALLQLLYQAGGAVIGEPGLSGLVGELPFYADLPLFARSLLLSFASNLTLFWLWSLMLIYFGARFALHGRRWIALLVLISWVIVLTLVPVLTGNIKAEASPATEMTDGMFMPSEFGEPPPEGEMPGLTFDAPVPESTEQAQIETENFAEMTPDAAEPAHGSN